MARAKVVEFDYYQFLTLMRRATDSGARIEKSDARWAGYVKEKGINEVAATAIARQKYESAIPVIIDEGTADTDGLYFYSRDEEVCLRLVALDG